MLGQGVGNREQQGNAKNWEVFSQQAAGTVKAF